MAATSFLAVFFLFLLILHSAEEEETYFSGCQPLECGVLGNISFPFSNTTHRGCGLCEVDCVAKTIQLGNESQWYEVVSISQANNTIEIHDKERQRLFNSLSCKSFENFTLPNSRSISFEILNNVTTFFKCTNSTELTNEYFRGIYSYTYCPGYSLYYSYPNEHVLTTVSLPPSCSVIQLPAPRNSNPNASDPFQLVTAGVFLQWYVSDECSKCHGRGGKCGSNEELEFRCTNVKEENHPGLLITKAAIATFAAGIGILAVTVFCFKYMVFCIESMAFCLKSMAFWRKKIEKYHNVKIFLKNYGSLAPKRYCYSDIKKMTNSFKVKLGQGGYGCVYKGKLCNGIHVAVKVLSESKGNGQEFINEVASISQTSHVNIVNLLGFCFDGRKRALVYEFMPNGSLEKFVYNGISSTNRQLGWEKSYHIAIGIARGLEYLHRGCNTQILHFDIKPHNILLDEDFCPKISDFGLAKLCPRKESTISTLTTRGTIGYIAPEVFCRNFGRVSHKSDVYSYGMMVLEMVGGRKNIEVEVDRTSEIYFPDWIYNQLKSDELALHGITNEEENESVRKMIIVSLWCIQTDPSTRPSMTKVVEMLEGSLGSLKVPPRPFLSSPPRPPADSSTIEIS